MKKNRTDDKDFNQNLQTLRIKLEIENTELRRSQQELMNSKIYYTRLYDTAPVGDFTTDLNGTIMNANMTLADMLSIERSSLLDNHITDYIVLEDHNIYYQHLKNIDILKTRQVCELRMGKKDGMPFDVRLETILITDRCKKTEQYRTVVIDISERKKTEREDSDFSFLNIIFK
ncbi:PAS domain-containing protein [Desulfobacter postgatei]|uniref:PAS domain-containing protein n=1 Tax=Desulfobacter postgatei TaxID=2293 RepID=UPI00259B637C|nr:PAS domain-containing protein [uncultured Desulfobacter sp.]